MNIALRYYTRSGNTKKLAEAAASVAGVKAESIDVPLSDKADILILGCSYYAFDVDPSVKEFILSNKDKIVKIVLVGTSAMMKSMKKPVGKIAKAAGIELSEEEFHCRGEFKFANKGRPNEEDLKGVKEFVGKIIKRNKE